MGARHRVEQRQRRAFDQLLPGVQAAAERADHGVLATKSLAQVVDTARISDCNRDFGAVELLRVANEGGDGVAGCE